MSGPQAKEMADESMVRNLAAQAEAIWPQEEPIFLRHGLPEGARVLDVGCGTGEITRRLAERFPSGDFTGVDVEEGHLARARSLCRRLGERVRFQPGDAYALQFPAGHFDLVVCRHVLQAVSDAERALAEMVRVLKPSGRLHLIAEDYGMVLSHPLPRDSDRFWRDGALAYGASVGCDLHVGRKVFTILNEMGLSRIEADYLTIDTIRVPRDLFAQIWEAWRDGYTESLVQHGKLSRAEIEQCWNEMIATARDPRGYALWQLPVWSAHKPAV